MQETKYGVDPMKEILRDGMKYGFKRTCIIHEVMDVMIHFLFMQSCIKNYINVDILTKLYFYVCRGKRPKRWNVKIKRINKTFFFVSYIFVFIGKNDYTFVFGKHPCF